MPSFPALLADPAWEHGCYIIPALGSMLDDHDLEAFIFFLGPGALLPSLHLVLLLQAEILQIRCLVPVLVRVGLAIFVFLHVCFLIVAVERMLVILLAKAVNIIY